MLSRQTYRTQICATQGTALLAVLLLVGCSSLEQWKANGFKVGPDYRRPCAPVAPDWIDSNSEGVAFEREHITDWWTALNDPCLEQLIFTAYQQNLPLRAVGLRVLEARSQFEISALNLLPQSQTSSGRYSRNQISTATANVFPGVKRYFDDWQYGFDASWELDLWGRIRRGIESADAALDAEIENYDDVLVTLIGDVAASYIELRSFDERLELAERNVELQAGSLKIAEARESEGRVSELDVEQAKSNVAETRALIPALRQGRRLVLNRLALLVGTTPYDLQTQLCERGEIPEIPPEIVVGVPADLLRRRPDVRAAERQVAAQSARIGIAEADLFPRFALTGQIGFNSERLSDLFSSASAIGTIAPGFSWNVLNYGRILRSIEIADLQFQQAVVNYQNVVLAAHREVEDAMVQFIETKGRVSELKKSAEAAAKSVELVRDQYTAGKVDFGQVFVLEAALVQRQDQLVASEAEAAIAMVQSYKALGGGWQLRLTTPYTGCGCEPFICSSGVEETTEYADHEIGAPVSPAAPIELLPSSSDDADESLIEPVDDPFEDDEGLDFFGNASDDAEVANDEAQ